MPCFTPNPRHLRMAPAVHLGARSVPLCQPRIDMSSGRAHDERAAARSLDKAVRGSWRNWHHMTAKARRDPGSRRRVHRFRVATRKLLAAEELLGTPPTSSPLRDRFDPAFRVAGRIRDLQICRTELARLGDRYRAVRSVERVARRRLPVLVHRLAFELRALKPKQVRQAVRQLRADKDSAAARRTRSRTLAVMRLHYRAARREFDRFARGLSPDSDDAALHSLRLRLKGLRYMSELLESQPANDPGPAQAFDTWQRTLSAIADQRATLREIDRCHASHEAPDEALAVLRRHVLRAERRRIGALFEQRGTQPSPTRQIRLLRTAPLPK
jgi:CHAD domain-containing protein